jgi:hypothetical protein
MLETLLRFPAVVMEEVIELNGAEERAFVAEVQQDAERLRQQAAAQQTHQANEAA